MCRVWNTELLLQREPGGGGSLPENTYSIFGVQSLEYPVTFALCMCRVWNTELLFERELGGGGSLPENTYSIFGVQSLEYPVTFALLHVQSLEY
jgi:hypothetical protein